MIRGRALVSLWFCALACSGTAHALQNEATPKSLRLAYSEDFVHAEGAALLAGRYGGEWGLRAGAWLH
ncbi:MAG TPA: hypothetical protein VFB01_08990, partial [Burkholderiales bacterium]|nr:hypothetical protein [Burkholderiales bacterium]